MLPEAPVSPGPMLRFGIPIALLALGARGRHVAPPALLWGLVSLCGAISGAAAGSASRAACTATVESGATVMLTARLGDRIPPLRQPDRTAGSMRLRASVNVSHATLVADGKMCSPGRLRLSAPRVEEGFEWGAGILVKGEWRRSGESALPRAESRYGYVSARSLEAAEGPVREGLGLPGRLRAMLASRLDGRMRTEELAGVAKALVLADRSTLDRETRQRFIDAGIVHLLAISGLHVGMIAGGIVWILGFVDRGRARWVRAAAVVTAYVVLIGAPPAATRAALLFAGHAYCRWRDRPGRVLDLAALAALLAVGIEPLLILDPGFQLSFAGFAGVIAGHGVGSRVARRLTLARTGRLRPILRKVAPLLSLTIASTGAFACTAPIAAVHFGRVVATSIPASVASTGIVAMALPAVGAATVLPGIAGELAADAASSLLTVLVAIADWFARAPFRWQVAPALGWLWATCGLLAVAALLSPRRTRSRHLVSIAAIVALALFRPAARRLAGDGTPLLCTLDVGQGDAAVLRTGAGRWLVFDAGPGTSILDGRDLSPDDRRLASWMGDAGRDVIVPFLRSHGVTEIELFALSHPHLDHFGGAGSLFDRFRVHHVLDPGLAEPSAAYLGLLERVDDERALWVRGLAGDRIAIDDATITVLWPTTGMTAGANETSLSFRLDVGGFAYLNTGDAPVDTELSILRDTPEGGLRVDLLKLGHHGSRTSSSVRWLEAARPALVVMSLGRDNRYGHPHAATLRRLDSAGVRRAWRTDREGTLCIEVGPDGWRVVDP